MNRGIKGKKHPTTGQTDLAHLGEYLPWARGDTGAAWVPMEMEAGSKAETPSLSLQTSCPDLQARKCSLGKSAHGGGVPAGDHFLREEGAGLTGRREGHVPRLWGDARERV